MKMQHNTVFLTKPPVLRRPRKAYHSPSSVLMNSLVGRRKLQGTSLFRDVEIELHIL